MIFFNGAIFTGDSQMPWAEALVVAEDRIAFAGSRTEAMSDPEAIKVDLKGRLVLPGFNDAHLHFVEGGRVLTGLNLREARNLEDFLEQIGRYARTVTAGQWITSWGWDHERWPERRYPTRRDVDRVSPQHPLLLFRLDGHVAVANSLALKAAGVSRATKIPGGQVLLDPQTGEPNGVLRDKAAKFVAAQIPPEPLSRRKEAIRMALSQAAKLGVTSVQEMGTQFGDYTIYRELAERGELTARVYAVPLFENRDLFRGLPEDNWLRVGGVKLFSDGSLGAASAWMFEPYDDEPETTGLALYSAEELRDILETADQKGWQICIHTIGTRANHEVVHAFDRILKNRGNLRRHRFEHVQLIRDDDLGHMARLGLLASLQPVHYWDDRRWLVHRIGERRLPLAYRLGSFFRAKIPVALGTDWPVGDLNPLLGIFSAVARNHDLNTPEEGISLKAALRAYTSGSAFAEFAENKKGRLREGQLADLVVLSENIFKLPPEEFKNVAVDLTLVGGKVVYQSEQAKF